MIRQASLTRLGSMLNTAVGNSKKPGKYRSTLSTFVNRYIPCSNRDRMFVPMVGVCVPSSANGMHNG